jgi:hypothetical protein
MIPFWQLGTIPAEEEETSNVLQKVNYFGTTRHGFVKGSKLLTDGKEYPQPSGDGWRAGSVSLQKLPNEYDAIKREEMLSAGYKEYAVLSGSRQQLYGENIDGWVFADGQKIRWLIQLKLSNATINLYSNTATIPYTIIQFGIVNADPNARYKSYSGTLVLSDIGMADRKTYDGRHFAFPGDTYWVSESGLNLYQVDVKRNGSQAILMMAFTNSSFLGHNDLEGPFPVTYVGVNVSSGLPPAKGKPYNPPILSTTVLRNLQQVFPSYYWYTGGTLGNRVLEVPYSCPNDNSGTDTFCIDTTNPVPFYDYRESSSGIDNLLVALYYDPSDETLKEARASKWTASVYTFNREEVATNSYDVSGHDMLLSGISVTMNGRTTELTFIGEIWNHYSGACTCSTPFWENLWDTEETWTFSGTDVYPTTYVYGGSDSGGGLRNAPCLGYEDWYSSLVYNSTGDDNIVWNWGLEFIFWDDNYLPGWFPNAFPCGPNGYIKPMFRRYAYNVFGVEAHLISDLYFGDGYSLSLTPFEVGTEWAEYEPDVCFPVDGPYLTWYVQQGPLLTFARGAVISPRGKISWASVDAPAWPGSCGKYRYGSYNPFGGFSEIKAGSLTKVCYV